MLELIRSFAWLERYKNVGSLSKLVPTTVLADVRGLRLQGLWDILRGRMVSGIEYTKVEDKT